DLEAATLSDVVDFHARHYRPDNATLVVVGDFEQKQVDAWIDKYFGAVPKPSTPLPPFEAREPAWQSDRVAKVTGPQVPLPAAELAKVKTQLVTQAYMSRQTALGLASAIADAAVLEGDAARVNTDLDDLQRVTAADVQRVMRKYVLDAHKVTIDYRQEEVAKK